MIKKIGIVGMGALGKKHGIAMPVNELYLVKVKEMEADYR